MRACAVVALLVALVGINTDRRTLSAQQVSERVPTATLIPATTITMASGADSNSPAVWEVVEGRLILFMLTSINGWSTRLRGSTISNLASAGRVAFSNPPPHGVWIEAIVPDEDGTWYGYYHNERPAEICGDMTRMLPRIGAARSEDFGATWEDLGTILEAPLELVDCDTTNRYFVGGVGDFSVALDEDEKHLYFFFSQYVEREETQGVAVGRMLWAHRDRPRGRMSVWWHRNTWMPARRAWRSDDTADRTFNYPVGVPIYRVRDGWHDNQTVDAFWGPSVHWNSYLERYVMLLNHAIDSSWRQEGIYVAFAKTLDDPAAWSAPRRLLMGGDWYPQVMGTEIGLGTDRVAGQTARFFMGGRSRYFIQFSR